MKVKIFYCDEELEEISIPFFFSGFDTACEIARTKHYTMHTMTHFKILYRGKWLYGNQYDKIKREKIWWSNKCYLYLLKIKYYYYDKIRSVLQSINR